MKLRLRGDSLRLRLTQSEVQALSERGLVEETTSFGPGAGAFTYAVAADLPAGAPLAARFEPARGRMEVHAAPDLVRAWASGNDVGFEGQVGPLRVLVEKDFACLKDRPHEDDADAFPNPNASC